MALVKRRVANPSPGILSLVNPARRKKNMAAKRRHSTRRKRHTTATRRHTNPAKGTRRAGGSRRRRRVAAGFKMAHKLYSSRPGWKRNPTRRHRRRRNPVSTGTIAEGFKLAVAGMVIGFVQPTVRNLIGRFLPTGPIASAGVTLGTAYGLGYLAKFTSFTRNWQRPIELAGWTIAATQLVTTYVLPALSGITAGAGVRTGMSGQRMRGIAAVTGVPPQILPPSPVPTSQQGMHGLATVPGRFY